MSPAEAGPGGALSTQPWSHECHPERWDPAWLRLELLPAHSYKIFWHRGGHTESLEQLPSCSFNWPLENKAPSSLSEPGPNENKHRSRESEQREEPRPLAGSGHPWMGSAPAVSQLPPPVPRPRDISRAGRIVPGIRTPLPSLRVLQVRSASPAGPAPPSPRPAGTDGSTGDNGGGTRV